MINDFKKVEGLFIELNSSMCKKVNAYVIGGVPLLRRGMKAATKDIDMVVVTRNEFIELQKALDKINFAPQTPGKGYTHMNLSQIFQRGEFRIDLFEKEVCRRFSLSESMIKRAEKVIGISHINVFLCSNEDIFLFKTMTERDGDVTDCISIAATQDINWNVMLEELRSQIATSGNKVWITWVGERLDLLENKGLDIPIMSEVNRLREAYLDEYEKRHTSH